MGVPWKSQFYLHTSSILKKIIPKFTIFKVREFLKFLKKVSYSPSIFFSFYIIFIGFQKALAILWHSLGSFPVSLVFSCRPFGCLWLVWAVFGHLWALSGTFCETLVLCWVPFVSVWFWFGNVSTMYFFETRLPFQC